MPCWGWWLVDRFTRRLIIWQVRCCNFIHEPPLLRWNDGFRRPCWHPYIYPFKWFWCRSDSLWLANCSVLISNCSVTKCLQLQCGSHGQRFWLWSKNVCGFCLFISTSEAVKESVWSLFIQLFNKQTCQTHLLCVFILKGWFSTASEVQPWTFSGRWNFQLNSSIGLSQ